MAEHQDKHRIFLSSTESIPPPMGQTERERKEEEKRQKELEMQAEAERRQEEAFGDRKKAMLQKWQAFLDDTTVREQIAAHGIEWGEQGFLVHMFVADFTKDSKILIEDDIFRKFTPYGMIVSASDLNEGKKKDWKVGDIVHVSDSLANVQINQNWQYWFEKGKASNGKLETPEPPKYIRKMYGWMVEGKLYAPDKSRYVLTNKYALLTEDSLRTYPGPYVFELSMYEVGTKRITKNPWA